jgi:cysteine desulfurase
MKEIGELCRSKGVTFHTDAAQAVGKVPLSVNDLKVIGWLRVANTLG